MYKYSTPTLKGGETFPYVTNPAAAIRIVVEYTYVVDSTTRIDHDVTTILSGHSSRISAFAAAVRQQYSLSGVQFLSKRLDLKGLQVDITHNFRQEIIKFTVRPDVFYARDRDVARVFIMYGGNNVALVDIKGSAIKLMYQSSLVESSWNPDVVGVNQLRLGVAASSSRSWVMWPYTITSGVITDSDIYTVCYVSNTGIVGFSPTQDTVTNKNGNPAPPICNGTENKLYTSTGTVRMVGRETAFSADGITPGFSCNAISVSGERLYYSGKLFFTDCEADNDELGDLGIGNYLGYLKNGALVGDPDTDLYPQVHSQPIPSMSMRSIGVNLVDITFDTYTYNRSHWNGGERSFRSASWPWLVVDWHEAYQISECAINSFPYGTGDKYHWGYSSNPQPITNPDNEYVSYADDTMTLMLLYKEVSKTYSAEAIWNNEEHYFFSIGQINASDGTNVIQQIAVYETGELLDVYVFLNGSEITQKLSSIGIDPKTIQSILFDVSEDFVRSLR